MDTAQLAGAAETDPNVALANAADAFKIVTSPPVPRDELGQFAPKTPETVEDDEPLTEQADTEEPEGEEEDEQEAALEAQPMPPSWPADEAEHWNALPPETQAYLAKREGERESAVQAKFQESANIRKAAEAAQAEAANNRQQYAQALDVVLQALQGERPDPRAYGAGTGQYDRESYDLALMAYEQQQQLAAQLFEQRQAVATEEQREAEQQFTAWKSEVEAQFMPKLLTDVPELTDPAKGEPVLRDLVNYAIQNGFPERLFAPENQGRITSPEIHALWKAKKYDELRAAKTEPKPKPASPAVKPGVSSPRSAQKGAQRQKAFDRLSRDGSVEAGAAVFKTFFK